MARVFITGSTDGLGLYNARTLVDQGHEVLLHARNAARAASLKGFADTSLGVVAGDLSIDAGTRAVAAQVNAVGRMDAIIHNAGVYLSADRATTIDGHSRTFAVNVLAPYLLTALIARPARLVYVTSGLHHGAGDHLDDIDWSRRDWNAARAYSESKLQVAAISSAASRLWPDVLSNAVDPGWVPTKMGGPSASDDLEQGHLTQSWLAVSDDPEALVSGSYWHHRRLQEPDREVNDHRFQTRLLASLAAITGVEFTDQRVQA